MQNSYTVFVAVMKLRPLN